MNALTLLSGLTLTSAAFTNFKEISTINIQNPAFVSTLTLQNEVTLDLTVTDFSAMHAGQVNILKNITNAFYDPSYSKTLVSQNVWTGFEWPNNALPIAKNAFTAEKRSKVCGASGDCTILTVCDGFLVPGHATGTIYLQPVPTLKSQKPMSPFAIAPKKSYWYYHDAQWVDMDGDGLLDIIAARAYTNVIGQSDGELIWLQQPADATKITSEWKITSLQKGPDILVLLDQQKQGVLSVYAPEFWGKKLSLTTIKLGKNSMPQVVSYDVIDDTLGPGYQIYLLDADGDGDKELVVSNHLGKDGMIFAYELPLKESEALEASKYKRITLSDDYVVTKWGMNQAAPGFPYPFYVDSKKHASLRPTAKGARPWFLVAGDGTQGVHIMYPVDDETNHYKYTTEKIIDAGGVIGSLSLVELSTGALGVVVPNYDDSKLSFYSFFN